jgi:chromosome segregation ATPase
VRALREQVEPLREDVERRASALDERERELNLQQDEVRQLWDQLDAERAEVQQKAQQSDARQQELEQQVQSLQQNIDDVTEAAAATDASFTAAVDEHTQVRRELEEQINRIETEMFELREQQATAESDHESLRQQVNRATAELDQRSTQLDDSQRLVLELQRRIDELEQSRSLTSRYSDQIDIALRHLHEPVELMRVASTRLAGAQQSVAELEEQWVRCDARFNEFQASKPAEARKALDERDRIAAQLEQAHAAQDAASAELRTAVDDVVRQVRAIPGPEAQVRTSAHSGSSGSQPSPRRRWFSRKN